jgi:hypothetical protein
MKFIEENDSRGEFTVRGHFESELFNTSTYQKELDTLQEISKEFVPHPLVPDRSYGTLFNNTDDHDTNLPLLAQMRDWWGISNTKSRTYLLYKRWGGTSTVHTDPMKGDTRYLIFCSKWAPGQVWFIGDQCYTNWQIGSVVDFDFEKTSHGNANASNQLLAFMQCTTINEVH